MGLPKVDIQIQNGNLGLVANTDDRVVGLVVNGKASDGLNFGQIGQIFSADSFKGFASAAYPAFSADYYHQMTDFYKEAGEGAEIWVMFVDPTITTAQLFSGGQIAALLDAAGGRINVLGVSRYLDADPAGLVTTGGIDADILSAMDEAQALADSYAALQKPLRVILDGRYFSGDTVGITNLKTYTYNRVGILLASNRATADNSCMGLLLGRIASSQVNRNIGRFKSGQVKTDAAYFTNGQTVESLGQAANALHDKGYIFLRKFVGYAGYYWNDDHMATKDTDDYFSLSRGRVIDKAARILYQTFVEEILDEVPVDDKGKIVPTVLKQYQEKAERAIGLTMGVNNEISFVECFIDPSQDILSTSQLVVDVRITPTGTNRVIAIKLGLFNPNVA